MSAPHALAAPQTVNHYVRAVRGFFRWLCKVKRVASNPVESLALLNANTDVRRGRRELTADELHRLLTATRASGRSFRGLTGEDSYHLYLTASATGVRANALAYLTPGRPRSVRGRPGGHPAGAVQQVPQAEEEADSGRHCRAVGQCGRGRGRRISWPPT